MPLLTAMGGLGDLTYTHFQGRTGELGLTSLHRGQRAPEGTLSLWWNRGKPGAYFGIDALGGRT